jgi:hypothetical protein
MNAVVVDEFVDVAGGPASRPGFERALQLLNQDWIDFLIVSSVDRLGTNLDEASEAAWRLGFAGTVVIPADKAVFPRIGLETSY